MTEKRREEIAIIGGSMAGLFAAINLKSVGFKVTLYERSDTSLANRGAGIATHQGLYDALNSAGITPRQAMGVESVGRHLLNKDGKIVHREDMHQIMSSWGLIYRFLRSQISDKEYKSGATLKGIEHFKNDKPSAFFDNGTSIDVDWIIGADGMHSTVRQIVNPLSKPIYAGYLAWRGLIEENLIDRDVRGQLENVITFGLAPAGHWLGYMVAGKDDTLEPGKRWYNWGWYRHATPQSLQDHLTGEDGQHFENGIPHHLIRQDLTKKMRAQASEYLAPQIQQVIQSTEQPFIQGMFDVGSNKLLFNRVILIGDAAFTARPHVGLGVSKAAEDAATLAKALSSLDQKEALQRWEKARKKYGNATLQWGRDLGSHIVPLDLILQKDSKASHYSSPDVLITQNASNEPQKFLSRYL